MTRVLISIVAAVVVGLAGCGGGGANSGAPPAPPAPPPPPTISKQEAFQLLDQASFGATEADAQQVAALGIEGWIDDQLSRPASLQLPFLQSLPRPEFFFQLNEDRVDIWFRNALHGEDQLRQRESERFPPETVNLFAIHSGRAIVGNFGSKKRMSSARSSSRALKMYLRNSSARSAESSRSANASSGSIIQNSARWRGVLEFSARKVGPKV